MGEVVLIYPRTLWDIKKVTTRLPFAVLYLGSILKENGYSVTVIDQRIDNEWEDKLREALKKASAPLWVGISTMTGRQIYWGLLAAKIVREKNKNIPLVWGGVHPTILSEQTIQHELVDLVIVGEGELTALELTKKLSEGRMTNDFTDIRGVVWKRLGETVCNLARPPLNMDQLPLLDYSLVDIENYILTEVPGERSLQIITSRGCPMHCGYCYLGSVPSGRAYRTESPERTITRINRIVKLFDVNSLNILDDEFFTNRKRARKVCELLIENKIDLTLRTNCRIDYIDRMSMVDLNLFRRAGFKHLYLGAESGNNRVLKFISKGITKEQIIAVNRKLKEADIAPKFSFMAGFPTETTQEVKETMRLMSFIVKENKSAYTTPVQLYSPYPGTPLFKYSQKMGIDIPKRFEEWAESGWENIDYSWPKKKDEQFLKKAAYFTFFLDGKTVAENMHSSFMRFVAKIYGWITRKRIQLNFFYFMPEVILIKKALSVSKPISSKKNSPAKSCSKKNTDRKLVSV